MEPTRTKGSPSRVVAFEALLNVVVISILAIRAVGQLKPPAALPATAPATAFSAERAVAHLNAIAREPHPTGTRANARVRDSIVEQLRSFGLEPEVQRASSIGAFPTDAPYGAGTVENVLVRLKGTQSTGAVLLMPHYDSVATGPGAADDGSGVVTVLETLRALRSGAPLRNDVVAVFTEGEEDGALGARAFVDEHPWARDVSVAVVIDSDGCGPAALGVKAPHNGWLVRELTRALAHPLAASIGDELSRLAGGSALGDDLPLREKGIAALSVGAAGCQTAYHTIEDTPANLDARTVQDLGTTGLQLVRHFGDLDLAHTSGDDVVYFPLWGHVILYRTAWALPLAAATAVIVLSVVLLGLKRRRLDGRGLAAGLVLWLVGGTVAGGFIACLWWALLSLHLVNRSFLSAYNAEAYALGFLGLSAATTSALYVGFRGRWRPANLIAGAFLVCIGLMGLACLSAPATSYLLVWPLVFATVPLGCRFAMDRPDSWPWKIAQLLCAVPAVVLFAPLIGYMVITLGEDLKSTFIIVGVLTVVSLALLAPQLEVMTAHRKWCLSGACAVVAVGFVSFGALGSGYDATHPKPDSISYWFDADAGRTSWISFDEAPDNWTSQFLEGQVEKETLGIFGSRDAVLSAHAPRVPLSAPAVETLEDRTSGRERTFRCRITSPRRARILWVIARNAAVLRATLDGKDVPVGEAEVRDKVWGFVYVGLPPTGILLDLTVNAPDSPELTITDQSDGLPEIPGFGIRPRSSDRMPFPDVWPFFDSTVLVSRTVRADPSRLSAHDRDREPLHAGPGAVPTSP
jgi:hypothetical protein